MTDLQVVRRELLIALRGKRSQTFVNRRLGYAFNQVYRWERGTTRLAWPDFVRLCEVCKAPLREAMASVLGVFDDPRRADLVVASLLRPAPAPYVTQVTGIARGAITHWRAGRATPSVEDVLCLVSRVSCAIVEFLGALVDLGALPSLRDEIAARAARAELLARRPEVEAVLAALELRAYAALGRHDDAFVASRAGIEETDARELLGALLRLGVVARRRGKLVAAERWFRTFDIRRDFAVAQKVKLRWLDRATHQLARAPGFRRGEGFSYYVFTASDEVLAAVEREYFEFVKRVVARVESAPPACREHVRVLQLSLFPPGASA